MNELKPIEYGYRRVLLTAQLAEQYGTTGDRVKKNYNNNKERYKERVDYVCLQGEELRTFKCEVPNLDLAENINKLYLWYEHGALLHAKSLGTDRAWEVYGELVDTYFKARQALFPQDYPAALRALADEAEKRMQLQWENAQQKQIIGGLKPKADYLDMILNSKALVTITQIAKDYGMSGQAINRKLHELGIQYEQGGQM